jgi:hypothetical protein
VNYPAPGLPELHGFDPRLCPGRPDYQENVETMGETPFWLGPTPFTTTHDFDWGGIGGCRWCSVTADQVRDRFRDWRYEQLVERLLTMMENS